MSSLKNAFLRSIKKPFFNNFNKNFIKELKRKAKIIEFNSRKNSKEFQIANQKVYLVAEGRLFLSCIEEDGKKIILDILSEGDVLGDLNFLDQEASEEICSDCIFLEPFPKNPIKLFEFKKKDFFQILISNPTFMFYILSDFSKRVGRLQEKIEELVFSRLKARLLYVLIQLSRPYGRGKFLKVDVKITHEKLGESTGAARETVSKALKELENEGFIFYNKRKNIIINLEEEEVKVKYLESSFVKLSS